jgi:serine/threonine protein kinase
MDRQSRQASEMRDRVFISYSHKDEKWMDKFSTHLKILQQTDRLEVWSDKTIQAGENWQLKIDEAISRARVALLLASADFFASEFICNEELPKILKKHQDEGLFLYWVPLGHAAYPKSCLAAIQAATDPKQPLEGLSEAEQNRIMSEITLDIGEKLGQSVRVAGDARQQVLEEVRQRLGGRIEVLEEIGSGDTSIVFKGRHGLRECAVKVLVSGGFSSGERERLRAVLDKAARLMDPAYIKVQDALLDGDPICIVGEYVVGRTLAHVLHQRRRLPPDDVISYVRQLARALAEAHQHGLARHRLLPSNLFIEESRIRLSPLVFLMQSNLASREHGAFHITKEAINYIPPEQYYGLPIQDVTDQYHLGLIALSMLQGGPPVPVRQLSDLAKLPSFFENPREFFDRTWMDQAPGLSRVIARMLSENPEERWDSMAAVVNAIGPLQRSRRGQEVHIADAKASYGRYCQARPTFYKAFYEEFFRRAPAAEELFAKVSMARQYEMIDEAIERLLNFREGPEPTTLSRTREAHRRLHLAAADFDHFGSAFLETLKTMGEQDREVLDSWYAVLRPGLDYMKQACAQESRPRPMRVRKPSPRAVGASSPRHTLPHAAADGAKAHG